MRLWVRVGTQRKPRKSQNKVKFSKFLEKSLSREAKYEKMGWSSNEEVLNKVDIRDLRSLNGSKWSKETKS